MKALYSINGKVVYGKGKGKFVGFPTANVQVSNDITMPSSGVYATQVVLNNQIYYGVTNIGMRPTVDDDKDITIETHIFDFNNNIYGQIITLHLFKKIRMPQKFATLSMLFDQIGLDCKEVKDFFMIGQISSRLFMDIRKREVKLDNQELHLSTKEFNVLYMLYSNPNVIFSKKEIYEAVWHKSAQNYCFIVENTIFRIRKKCKIILENENFILTIKKSGYKFNIEK